MKQPYPSYKNIDAGWLREIPSQWKLVKFKYLFDIRKRIVGELGHDVLSITQKGIKIKDIDSGEGQVASDYTKYQLVKVGDFAMNHMDLLTGFVDISKFEGVTSPDYRVFTLKEKACLDKFCLYLLQMGYIDKIFYPLGQGAAHVGRWRLPADEFLNFKAPIPSYEEQVKIVKFLDKELSHIDTLIEEKQNFISLLEEKRQALISHVVTKGLDKNVKMKDSGVKWIGEIPTSWITLSIKYLSSCNDEALPDSTPSDYPILYVDIGSVSKIKGIQKKQHMTFGESPSRARRLVRDGDVIISTVRTYLEAVAPIVSPEHNLVVSTGFAVIRPRSVNPRYLQYFLRSSQFMNQVAVNSTGVSYPAINSSSLINLKIAFPVNEEQQQEIVEYLDLNLNRYAELESEVSQSINLLKEHRSALISAVVTGKIDVREAV